jgi:hypothetical protein
MSNFLQRIAASAAHGQSPARPRLHPMLGSIYAPTIPKAIEGDTAAAIDAFLESVTNRPVVTANASRTELLFAALRDDERYSSSLALPQRFAPQRDGLLFPGELAGDVFAGSALNRPLRNEGDPARREPEVSAQAYKAHRSGAAKSDSDERTGARHIQPPTIPVQSLRVATPSRVDPARRASTPWNEPDEIHIHIGKIEVAAVAPPPPRAAVSSPRKGINLDEYLRRGSGGRR